MKMQPMKLILSLAVLYLLQLAESFQVVKYAGPSQRLRQARLSRSEDQNEISSNNLFREATEDEISQELLAEMGQSKPSEWQVMKEVSCDFLRSTEPWQ